MVSIFLYNMFGKFLASVEFKLDGPIITDEIGEIECDLC